MVYSFDTKTVIFEACVLYSLFNVLVTNTAAEYAELFRQTMTSGGQ